MLDDKKFDILIFLSIIGLSVHLFSAYADDRRILGMRADPKIIYLTINPGSP